AASAECASCSELAYGSRTSSARRPFSLRAFSSAAGAPTSRAWDDSAKSKGSARAHANAPTAASRTIDCDQPRSGLVAAPIIVRCLWFPIGSCGKQVVAVRVLETRIAVNVIILPRIFWQSLIQLIPARWPRIGIWLGHERLQTLFSRRIKTVHAFIKLKLGVDSLEISGNSNMPRIFHVAR